MFSFISSKALKRGMSGMLAVLLACGGTAVAAARTEADAGDAAETQVVSADGLSYYAYTQAHADFPLSAEERPLELAQGTLSDEGAKRLETYLNEGAAVQLEKGGYIEWTIDVPADAGYTLKLRYAALPGKGQDIAVSVQLDGEVPFAGARSTLLKRVWKDADELRQDSHGNDLIPRQEEVFAFQNVGLKDTTGYIDTPYVLYLTKGTHTLRLTVPEDGLVVNDMRLGAAQETALPTYAEKQQEYRQKGYQPIGNVLLDYQGEKTTLKSDQTIYPVADRANASTVPNDPRVVRRNVIGQSSWADSGRWISYTIDNIPEDGLYALTIKYRQNTSLGVSTFRNIYINGEIPYAEMRSVAFPFGFGWQNKTVTDENGTPCYVYLKKGVNTISFEVTIGNWGNILQAVSEITTRMNTLYRRIIIVTSTNPDTYRDYQLEREISGLKAELQDMADQLAALADEYDRINGEKSTQSEPLRRVSEQLAEFAAKTAVIPKRLSNFRDNIAMLSEWLMSSVKQPLEIDYFLLHSADATLPSPKGSFWSNLKFSFYQFLAAFSDDYNTMSDYAEGEAISVWTADGRDQAQIIKDMILDEFTPDTGIQINLNLVQTGFVEATLSGNGPDVALSIARGQPVNLASRGALADLSQFADFNEVKQWFGADATVPYSYNGGTYALPITQTFLMMFYRTDIFEELQLKVPQTWTEVFDVVAVLQRKNMTMGLPYSAITAQGAVDVGVGAKDLFPTLLMQYGGDYYADDLSKTALDSTAALEAFKTWTSFYTKYGFDLTYDFNTRFRTGEMPLAISSFGTYGVLSAAAPEIRGQWAMVPVPGVEQEDGSILRTGGGSGTAAVIFEKAENKEACWSFLKWLTSAQTQARFGNAVESLLGPAGRHATANLEAFSQLNWTAEEQEQLKTQRAYIREVPEVPGSYFMSRCMDNAFRDVLFNNRNPRVALEKENANINRELERKRIELSSRNKR